MSESSQPGIYLIIEFDWPRPFTSEQAKMAGQLHNVVQNKSWIKEVVAASGGLGSGPSSLWIFWLESYAALDTLLKDQDNEVCKAYLSFFSEMIHVCDKVREAVIFQ
jgi:hypothetical protein